MTPVPATFEGPNRSASRTRRIVMVAFDGVQALDVTGPTEVFSLAARLDRNTGRDETAGRDQAARLDHKTSCEIELVAHQQSITTSSGLNITPHVTFEECRGPIDTLIVAGGTGVREAVAAARLITWLRLASPRARRTASVCTGAFLLAEAGLLEGRKATTHWAACETLARTYPTIEVQPDPIYVRDGNVYTSAGVTAGIDLALGLVEEDFGADLALAVARELVLFIRRPGGQAQFSQGLSAQAAGRPNLRRLQDWIAGNLEGDLSVTALADRAFMSQRNFARVFTAEVGMTPAAYVEGVRLERARMLLETTGAQLEEISRQCGFGTVETLRRAFARRLHVSPSEYRERFATVIPLRRSATA